MNIIIQDMAHNSIDAIFNYLYNYSVRNAIKTIDGIYDYIYDLEYSPYLSRYIPEVFDKRFREIIYRKTRHSGYRIIYYISEHSNNVYIISIINCKQDFNTFLKLHNYFKNYHIL